MRRNRNRKPKAQRPEEHVVAERFISFHGELRIARVVAIPDADNPDKCRHFRLEIIPVAPEAACYC